MRTLRVFAEDGQPWDNPLCARRRAFARYPMFGARVSLKKA